MHLDGAPVAVSFTWMSDIVREAHFVMCCVHRYMLCSLGDCFDLHLHLQLSEMNALMWAAMNNYDNIDIAALLIRNGAKVNAQDPV